MVTRKEAVQAATVFRQTYYHPEIIGAKPEFNKAKSDYVVTVRLHSKRPANFPNEVKGVTVEYTINFSRGE